MHAPFPDPARLLDLLSRAAGKRVLAVGDIYLDEMTEGAVNEVSLEAPIPVFEVHRRKHNPGAAGNAACNAAALGGAVQMVGVVGADPNADIVREAFRVRGVDTSGIVCDPARPTSTYGKLRASAPNRPSQEVLRLDTPRPQPLPPAIEAQVIRQVEARAPEAEIILVGDQVSATITRGVRDAIRAAARAHGCLCVADSRARAHWMQDMDLVVPNDAEAAAATGIAIEDDASLDAVGAALLQVARNACITRGAAGISVFEPGQPRVDVPVPPCHVVDVTGAGDTVAAAMALARAAGGTWVEAAQLANIAASIAVGQEGAVTVSAEEVAQALRGTRGPAKLSTLPALRAQVARLKGEGKRVVWTNGCFDILHAGHITYLLQARQLGDVLVLGLNSDASVRAIKGPTRPVVNEIDRATVLSALSCVDHLLLFDDPSPYALIEALQPDVYAKGGDYTLDTINQDERRLVEGYGGAIEIIPGVAGASTTSIIEKVLTGEG